MNDKMRVIMVEGEESSSYYWQKLHESIMKSEPTTAILTTLENIAKQTTFTFWTEGVEFRETMRDVLKM